MHKHYFILGLICFLSAISAIKSNAQDNQTKAVNHILWINIPELTKAGIDSSECKNIRFIAKKGYSNYQVASGKSPFKELLFSCEKENIMQALETNNSDVKTAVFVANKNLYKTLSDIEIDNLKNGKNDIELTEWAYESLRNDRPNFLFVNFSGIEESVKRGNSNSSKEYQRAVSEVDVMISGIFKGLIESRLFGKTAIVLSSFSNNENGVLFIQADNFLKPQESTDKISLENILPTINELIGKVPGYECEASSVVQIN